MELTLRSLLVASLLLCCARVLVKATAVISPPETAPTCTGDQLELTCNVTGSSLKWGISLFSSTGDETYSRILSTFSETTYLQINNTHFTFSRVSPQSSLPLESVMLISPVSSHLNGTVVSCTDRTTGKSSSTIIEIITDLDPYIDTLLLSEQFERDGVVVTLEWSTQWSSYLYNITVAAASGPLVELAYTGVSRLTFNVSYNNYYSVNITALPTCRLSTAIILYYVSCGDPTILTGNSSKISIADYRPPAVEGTHIYFYCPHGLLLSGHNMSTCMGNGEWEPTPREVECKAMQMDTNQGSGSPSQSVLIITTLAAVCAIASSLFFTAGCLCNRYCPKQKQLHESTNIGDQENTQHREMRVAIEQIELTENVAYSQVQIRRN